MLHPICSTLPVKGIDSPNSERFFSLYLGNEKWDYRPGQFVMIRPCSWDTDPVWPRPFSICESTDSGLRIFFQIAGRGTRYLAGLKVGDNLKIWGPLGNGFDFRERERLLILAGGMGIAPFIGFVKNHPHPENIRLVFGHTASADCFPLSELPLEIGKKVLLQETEEDLLDFQSIIREEIRSGEERRILACGPLPFLRFLQKTGREKNAQIQISLENTMACGVGACLGCVQENSEGEFVSTCRQGPVFPAHKIRI